MPVLDLPTLPSRADVLLDANVLVYALLGRSAQCDELLRRCHAEDVYGYVTVEVLAELCHRLMVTEAWTKGHISKPAASALRANRRAIPLLTEYWLQMQRIEAANVSIMELDLARFDDAEQVRRQYSLMTNDSLIVAAAAQFGIAAIASNDSDFGVLLDITIYAPTDVPAGP